MLKPSLSAHLQLPAPEVVFSMMNSSLRALLLVLWLALHAARVVTTMEPLVVLALLEVLPVLLQVLSALLLVWAPELALLHVLPGLLVAIQCSGLKLGIAESVVAAIAAPELVLWAPKPGLPQVLWAPELRGLEVGEPLPALLQVLRAPKLMLPLAHRAPELVLLLPALLLVLLLGLLQALLPVL